MPLAPVVLAGAAALALLAPGGAARVALPGQSTTTLVSDSTTARYNAALGNALNGTQPQFPPTARAAGPTLSSATGPSLAAVAGVLGNWLANPPSLSGSWSGPQAIPKTWPEGAENAIVYELDGGAGGIGGVSVSIGVDNGVYVWLNGVYKFGALAPGAAEPGEYTFSLGDLPAGKSYLQVLREDHGGNTGWTILVTGRPQAAPLALEKLADSKEFRIFLGLDDPADLDWLRNRTLRSRALVSRVRRYPGVTREAEIPGEESGGKHSPSLLLPGNDLFVLLALDHTPLALFPTGNVYARATPRFEQELRRKILSSPGELEPADIVRYALQVTRGSYPLAVLTAHNLLKNAAKTGRQAIEEAGRYPTPKTSSQAAIAKYNEEQEKQLAKLRKWTPIVAKLASLRAEPAFSKDKMGPWYHVFAVLSAGALTRGETARDVVVAEHGAKLANFFRREGGFDREKFLIDSSYAAAAGALAPYSRWFGVIR